MKTISLFLAAASFFALAPIAAEWEPVSASLAFVALGIVVAVAASGRFDALAISTGALGAFGAGMLGSVSPAVAGAVIVAAAFAERTMRVRLASGRAVHVLVALAGGGFAGGVSSAYAASSLTVSAVAAVVSAVLASLPLLIEADDPVSHELEQAGLLVREPAKGTLLSGAELRRRTGEVSLDGATRARVAQTWRSLLRLAEARVRLERTRSPVVLSELPSASAEAAPGKESMTTDVVIDMLDHRLAEHVAALARAHAGVDAVSAAQLGLDDAAVKTVESMGDSLDEVSRALVEVRTESPG